MSDRPLQLPSQRPRLSVPSLARSPALAAPLAPTRPSAETKGPDLELESEGPSTEAPPLRSEPQMDDSQVQAKKPQVSGRFELTAEGVILSEKGKRTRIGAPIDIYARGQDSSGLCFVVLGFDGLNGREQLVMPAGALTKKPSKLIELLLAGGYEPPLQKHYAALVDYLTERSPERRVRVASAGKGRWKVVDGPVGVEAEQAEAVRQKEADAGLLLEFCNLVSKISFVKKSRFQWGEDQGYFEKKKRRGRKDAKLYCLDSETLKEWFPDQKMKNRLVNFAFENGYIKAGRAGDTKTHPVELKGNDFSVYRIDLSRVNKAAAEQRIFI